MPGKRKKNFSGGGKLTTEQTFLGNKHTVLSIKLN